MRKRVAIGVLCLIAVAALASAGVALVVPFPRVYSVAEVQAGLHRNVSAWAGRTVLIRGQDTEIGFICGTSPKACYRTPDSPDLLVASPDPRTWHRFSRITPALVLIHRNDAHVPAPTTPTDLIVRISRLPVLGSLIPASLLERGAVYRVRLLAPAHCTLSPCEQGELQ